MKRNELLLTLAFAILFLASCVDAQRTSRISRPCPASTTPASVELDREGDVNITPCSGRTISTGGSGTFQVYDPAWTGSYPTQTSAFKVGSTTPIVVPSANNFGGVDFGLLADMSATSGKAFRGVVNRYGITGNGTGTSVTGFLNIMREGVGYSGTMNSIYGISNTVSPNQGHLTGPMYGIFSTMGPGGASFTTDPTVDIVSISGTVRHGYSITADRVTSLRGLTLGVNSNPGVTVEHLIGLDIEHRGGGGVAANNTVTNRYGIYIGNYSAVGLQNYTVTNNYGIFLDSTIDETATNKYAIYSQSVSPSLLSGPLSFDATFAGVAGNQTINKPAFEVKIGEGETAVTVTNSFITADNRLLCTVQTNDATLKSVSAVVSPGSVTLHGNAAADADTRVYCEVRYFPSIPD